MSSLGLFYCFTQSRGYVKGFSGENERTQDCNAPVDKQMLPRTSGPLTNPTTSIISFVHPLAVFADLYNFLEVWRSRSLTVLTELCSLVFTVNCRKTENLSTVVQSCSSFRGTAKFTAEYSLMRVIYLRCSIWNSN